LKGETSSRFFTAHWARFAFRPASPPDGGVAVAKLINGLGVAGKTTTLKAIKKKREAAAVRREVVAFFLGFLIAFNKEIAAVQLPRSGSSICEANLDGNKRELARVEHSSGMIQPTWSKYGVFFGVFYGRT
jgi:hypothetical protein